jgi:hypothetical protein
MNSRTAQPVFFVFLDGKRQEIPPLIKTNAVETLMVYVSSTKE